MGRLDASLALDDQDRSVAGQLVQTEKRQLAGGVLELPSSVALLVQSPEVLGLEPHHAEHLSAIGPVVDMHLGDPGLQLARQPCRRSVGL